MNNIWVLLQGPRSGKIPAVVLTSEAMTSIAHTCRDVQKSMSLLTYTLTATPGHRACGRSQALKKGRPKVAKSEDSWEEPIDGRLAADTIQFKGGSLFGTSAKTLVLNFVVLGDERYGHRLLTLPRLTEAEMSDIGALLHHDPVTSWDYRRAMQSEGK